MGKGRLTTLAEYYVRYYHVIMGAAHTFSGFGFFALLNGHFIVSLWNPAGAGIKNIYFLILSPRNFAMRGSYCSLSQLHWP